VAVATIPFDFLYKSSEKLFNLRRIQRCIIKVHRTS